ncbi:hypothetical protein E4T50_03817 [Aureobasidium sp. EXF-12298]|nr:hypothetical protein E4T50_03817 [Aureobasidium sp. EXF-12298]KAI4759911.1 hypothetical protein E4T51_07071 [Aureobasidium sp. EXF-12344]KAI4779553.1 hypothetical protein E4T52_05519 [Aureobasidium sp. EXF-3400]
MSHSAFLRQPPANQDDFYITKGMYRAAYAFDKDASKGYLFVPKKPENYEYNDKQASIIVGMVMAIVIMLFTTALRLALRQFRTGVRWGADDWVLIPGAIAMVVHGGGGKHTWDVTYAEYYIFNKLAIVCKIIFFTTVGIIKISICLFLRRISEATSKYPKIANDVFLFLLITYTLLALFWSCFQCSPAPAMWDKIYSGKLAHPAKCWSTLVVANTLSVIHVVMDFVLLLTPITVLWNVRLNKKTKIRLFIVFSMGSLSCVASILRELSQKSISKDITLYIRSRSTDGYTSLLAWTVVDLTLAVVVASLPVISALIPKAWGDLTHSSRIRMTTPGQATSKGTQRQSVLGRARRNSIDSEEDGILREDRIELSYARNSKRLQPREISQSSLFESPRTEQAV